MDKSRIRSVQWWQFHHLLWRYKFVVAAIVIMGTFTSVVYTSRIEKQYRATSSAMVDSFSNINSQDYGSGSTDLSRAHKVLAESSPVKEKAIALSGLTEAQTGLCSFEARVDGVLIYFSITDGDYAVAKRLSDAWADAFIKELGIRAHFAGESQVQSLSDQLKVYQVQWETANHTMAEFFKNTNFDPVQYPLDPIHGMVTGYEQQMRLAESQLASLNAELKIIDDAANDNAKLVELADVKGNVPFLERLRKAKESEANLADKKIEFREGAEWHTAEEQLKQAGQLLGQARKELAGALTLKRQVTQSEFADAQKKFLESKEKRDKLGQNKAQFSALSTEIESIKRSYDLVNDRLRVATLELRTSRNNVIKWEEAPEVLHPVPFKPSWRQNISMGFVLSFVLACALVFGLEQIDDTVHTPKDLEQRMGANVLGAVPACGRINMDREGYFLAKRQSASIAVDALRGIHIALEVGRKGALQNGSLVITVTSAVPQDGKSFVTSNLGILFASLGRKVLVVDADLRKASLSKALGSEDNDGFFEIVKNQKWSRSYALNGKTPGYYLLPAGHVAEAISESLHPESVYKLVEQMRADFDVILFDTPPVLALPDACVLGQLSDVTVLVTRSRHTRMAQAERAAATLYSAKIKELDFVVNGVDAADAAAETYGSGSGYGYGYGYGYGKGYGRDDASMKSRTRLRKSVPVPESDDEDEDGESSS